MNLELLKDHIKRYNPNHQGLVSKVLDDKMTRRQISRARYASLADRIQALDEPTRDTDILTKVYRAMDAMADVYTVKKLVEKAEAKANRLTKQSAPTTIPKQIPEKTPEEKIRESYGEKLSKEDEAELLEWIVKELKGGTPVERLKWTVKARYGPEYVRFVDKLTKKPSKASPKKKTPAKKPPAKKPVRKKAIPKFKPENVKQHKGVKALSNEDLEWIYETLVRGRLTPGQLEGRVNVSFGPKYVYLVNMINKKWVGR